MWIEVDGRGGEGRWEKVVLWSGNGVVVNDFVFRLGTICSLFAGMGVGRGGLLSGK